MTDDDITYAPDGDATELDRAIMEAAERLRITGWTYEANRVASSAAYLRETPTDAVDDLPGLIDALNIIASSALSIRQVLIAAFPDEIALRESH